MTHSKEERDSARLDWIDDIADRFEAAWHERPVISTFLDAADPDNELPLLLELIKVDLEYRRHAGEACRLEDYFDDFPALKKADQATRDDLILYARQVGTSRGPKELGSPTSTVFDCPHCGEQVSNIL